MDEIRNFLKKILDLISYSDNKDAFIDKFIDVCHQQTLLSLINELPPEKKAQFVQQTKDNSNPEQINSVIKDYFSDDQYNQALTKTANEGFKAFLEEVSQSLSQTQKDQLTEFLATQKPV